MIENLSIEQLVFKFKENSHMLYERVHILAEECGVRSEWNNLCEGECNEKIKMRSFLFLFFLKKEIEVLPAFFGESCWNSYALCIQSENFQ